MKISKKILTFLAPIASIGIVAPIITSCGTETLSFSYGDSISCFNAKDEDLKTIKVYKLDTVKNSSKNRVNHWDADTATDEQLKEYLSKPDTCYSNLYFDLIASLANMSAVPFAIKWSVDGNGKITTKWETSNGVISITEATINTDVKYEFKTTADDKQKVVIQFYEPGTSAEKCAIDSYAFKDVTKAK